MINDDFCKLTVFLENCNKENVTLTLNEIEKITGGALPSKAKESKWWWNVKGSSRAECWMKAGFYTIECKLIPARNAVVFKKRSDAERLEFIENNYFKKLWYFLSDSEGDRYKKIYAFLQILVIPLISILTLFFTILPFKDLVNKNSGLEIIDIKINKTEQATCLNFDFYIHNTTDDSKLISQVNIIVKDYYEMAWASNTFYYRLDQSHTYNAEITGNTIPEIITIDTISQVVPYKDYDSFAIQIASGECGTFRQVVTLLEFEFVCDDGKLFKSGDYLVAFDCAPLDKTHLDNANIYRSAYDNYIALQRFNTYECTYVMQDFNDLFNSYDECRTDIIENGIIERNIARIKKRYEINSLDTLTAILEDNYSNFEYMYNEIVDDGVLYAYKIFSNDKLIYIIAEDDNIKSIYIPAYQDDLDTSVSLFFSIDIFERINPSGNNYWFSQRIVDLPYFEDLRFWRDDRVEAFFVNFNNTEMLKFDIIN